MFEMPSAAAAGPGAWRVVGAGPFQAPVPQLQAASYLSRNPSPLDAPLLRPRDPQAACPLPAPGGQEGGERQWAL